MSLYLLLIFLGVVGAAAFFFAGFFLRVPNLPPATPIEPTPPDPAPLFAEHERLLKELSEVRASERTLGDRLRNAENEIRAAFEREENTAIAWEQQLTLGRTDRQKQEQALKEELAALQSQLVDASTAQASMLEAKEAAWRNELAETSRKLDQATMEVMRISEECESLRRALTNSQTELNQIQSQSQNSQLALHTAEARLVDMDRLLQEQASLREALAQAEVSTQNLLERDHEAKDIKADLVAAQAKLTELDRLVEENRKLRDRVTELAPHQDSQEELQSLLVEHKRLRLDAELLSRRVQELQAMEAELIALRTQAQEFASVGEEVVYLRRREKDLEAQLYASGFRVCEEIQPVADTPSHHSTLTDMESSLDSLLANDGPRTAVLADAQGFLIAAAGEAMPEEGLAAFAAVAGDMVTRARMLLPLAEVDSVHVTDRNRMVLACHLFQSEGQGLGLCTLGPGAADPVPTAQAVIDLASIMAPSEDTES